MVTDALDSDLRDNFEAFNLDTSRRIKGMGESVLSKMERLESDMDITGQISILEARVEEMIKESQKTQGISVVDCEEKI